MSLDKSNQTYKKTSFLTGINSDYIEEYYSLYLQNPKLLPKDWIEFFDGLKEDSKNIIEIKLLEMSNSNPVLILPILSDHYFKHREFKKSFDALLELNKIENFNAKKWLSFSNNLRKEKAYSLAVKSYQFALKKDLKAYQYGEGLLGLAKTFEDQIFPIEKNDIIPFFYNDNV